MKDILDKLDDLHTQSSDVGRVCHEAMGEIINLRAALAQARHILSLPVVHHDGNKERAS